MRLLHRPLPRLSTSAWFLIALLAAFLYFTLRNIGLYPTVFGDEWSYSSFTRLMPFKETLVPSYLYYTVYRLTNYCGDGFLECARLINAVFYIGAAPFIYLIARQYMTRQVAAAVAVLALLAPTNSYTAYFMPEAMYYCGFWLFSWSVLRAQGRVDVRTVALSSVVLGLLAMVKVHALFLIPGYVVYLAYACFAQRGAGSGGNWRWLRQALLLVAVALVTAAVVRFAVGYLYAGRNGLYLLGKFYSNQAQTRPTVGVLIQLALGSLQGHLMALVLMFGMPLASAALLCASRVQRQGAARGSSTLLAYAALLIPSLVAVTALFTAMVAGGGTESGARLHMRYYDFALPLMLVLAGAQLTAQRPGVGWRARLAVALPLLLATWAASHHLVPAFTPNYIDSPALYGMVHDEGNFGTLTGLGVAALLLWIVNTRQAARCFVYLYTPVALVISGDNLNQYTRMAQRPDAYVKAGIYAHQYLTPAEIKRLTIVGADMGNLLKSRFFVDGIDVSAVQLAPGRPIALESLAHQNGWLLVVGDYPLPAGAVRHSGSREFTLARVKPPAEAGLYRFAEAEDESMRSTGLSGMEDWGRWSEGGQVTLTFAQPLPKQLLLRLDVAAYGPNAGMDFDVTAGGQTVPLRADGWHGVKELRFSTDGTARVITIKVPKPTSPQELGAGGDQRKLGIAMYNMETLDAAAPRP
ncbi:hypothetical protein [Duganella sp. HH101]|uniref:DUF7024 domain-containing protein n=1 Tax=Duganella sp. HH101 TaxID=1781066 RepID=UPI0008740898|nr:hypothetical protein [Duganella sp. HH101]OFA02584.1 phosphoglycerol transferase I [Duganella sp. HH101]